MHNTQTISYNLVIITNNCGIILYIMHNKQQYYLPVNQIALHLFVYNY